MTTSEPSSSPKGLIVEYISSSIYRDITPSSLAYLKKSVENGRGESLIFSPSYSAESDEVKRVIFGNCKKIPGCPTYAISAFSNPRLNFHEAIALLEKIQLIVLSSEEGMGEFLDKAFDPNWKVRRGKELGTLRVFSEDLMCFWTGKNWRKIRKSEAK